MAKLTKAEIVGLTHVRDGLVWQRFTAKGNTFIGPKETAPRVWRKLQELRLIEDAPGQKPQGAYATNCQQQLSFAGRIALAEAGQ